MGNHKKIVVLKAFDAYLHILLEVNNEENFEGGDRNRLVRKVCLAAAINLLVAIIPIVTILMIVYVVDNGATISILVVSLPHILTMVQFFSTFVTMAAKNRFICDTIATIQTLVDNRCEDSEQSFECYNQTEKRFEFLLTSLQKVTIAIILLAFLLSAMCPVSHAVFGYPPPQLWLPFQMHSLSSSNIYVAFLIDWTILFTAINICSVILTLVGSFSSGLCLYINGMMVDMKDRLNFSPFGSPQPTKHTRRWLIYKQEIDFHNEIIDLADALSHIMETTLFTMALTCTTVIALNLFAVELSGLFSMATMSAFLDLFAVLSLAVIYSYLSEWITSDLLEIGDIFYNSAWYQLPVNEQRLLTLPIGRAQREFRLSGLGLFDCSLAVLSSIIRTAGSYFVILRSFQ